MPSRRTFLRTASTAAIGSLTGCLTNETEPKAVIEHIRLKNHRREKEYVFTVRIREDDEVLFKKNANLRQPVRERPTLISNHLSLNRDST